MKVHVYMINFTIFFRQDFEMSFVFLVIKVSCSATMTFMIFLNVFILFILHLIKPSTYVQDTSFYF